MSEGLAEGLGPHVRVNTLMPGDRLSVTEYDDYDNVVRELTPANRARVNSLPINQRATRAIELSTLYTYERKVDVIYIDPPYNTGARDWKYNNDYVDQTDAWRHSKWLSMLKKRLTLAKRLLKRSGVLIVTIDEHEVHHLGALLEDLFSAYSRQMVTNVINEKSSQSPASDD